MSASPRRPRAPRRMVRGITLFGLVFWGVIVAFFGYVAVTALPTLNEYFTIQRAINKIADSPPATVPEVRAAFDRQRDIEYSITSISGKDLEVTKEDERVVIRFAYEKEIPLAGPVFLLLKYEGRSK